MAEATSGTGAPNVQPANTAPDTKVAPSAAEKVPAAASPGEAVKQEGAPRPDPRAAALAAAKRKEAQIRVEREKLTQERQTQAEQLKKAAEFDRLDALRRADPMKFMEEAGLQFKDLSERYIKKLSGDGKTPAEIAKEVAEQTYAEKEAVKAQAAKLEADKAEEQRLKAAEEGASRQMMNKVKADVEKYDLCSRMPEELVLEKAWQAVKAMWSANKKLETNTFDKALAGVEQYFEDEQRRLQSGSKRAKKIAEELRQAELDAAKKKPAEKLSGAKTRSSEEPRHGDLTTTQSLNRTPQRRRPLLPTDQARIAAELWASAQAKRDN